MTYVKQLWPSWRFGPNGESEIFESDEQVPAGWLDHPAKFTKPVVAAAAITQPVAPAAAAIAATNEQTVEKLMAEFTQANLVGMLEAMAELDETIEFAPNWPKLRLATTIVANGGPLEN